jgi:cytochrome c oxidase subunit 2
LIIKIINNKGKKMSKLFYLGVTNGATPYANVMNWLHQEVFFYLVIICIFVLVLMIEIIRDFWFKIKYPLNNKDIKSRDLIISGIDYTHSSKLEVVWTMFPSLVLYAIAFPSLDMLYLMDQVLAWGVYLKVIGHQWYWSYEVVGKVKYNPSIIIELFNEWYEKNRAHRAPRIR